MAKGHARSKLEPIMKFGFANGGLPGHVESGDERLLIEWDRVTDRVAQDLLALSKPDHILIRWGNL